MVREIVETLSFERGEFNVDEFNEFIEHVKKAYNGALDKGFTNILIRIDVDYSDYNSSVVYIVGERDPTDAELAWEEKKKAVRRQQYEELKKEFEK